MTDMEDWDLYLVTEKSLSAGRQTIEVVKRAVAGGIDVIQLREKKMTTRDKYHLGGQIKEVIAGTGIDLIINDDLGLAQALDADGVHLGVNDMPVDRAREILGPNKLIGYSTSKFNKIETAINQGVDYIGFGAIYETNSKQNLREEKNGVGLDRLSNASNKFDIPLVAIGGIDRTNIAQVKKAGADAIAMITEITRANNVQERVMELKKKIIGVINNDTNERSKSRRNN
jgi:thiamine-phosphate pyrophosphorylase